jgi:hypothetical protein
MLVNVKINEEEEGYGEPFIVARLVDNELWYYGRYKTYEKAFDVAEQFENAIVAEVRENE